MEIQESSLPGFYFNRILGLAPYLIRRNSKHRIVEIRQSSWLCFYSICFMIVTVTLAVRILFVDAEAKVPVRMRTPTSKFVTVFDVGVLVSVCLCGGISGIVGRSLTQKINSNLHKVDDELVMYNEEKKDKKKNLIMMLVVLLVMTGLILLDNVSRWLNSIKYREWLEKHDKPIGEIHVESYLPFYLQYYILIALQLQLAQTALGVQRRYVRLNLAIKNIFSLSKMEEVAYEMKADEVYVRNVREMETIDPSFGVALLPDSNIDTDVNQNQFPKLSNRSRVAQEGNHLIPAFGTGKYSATLSTTSFGKLATTTTLTRASFFLDRLTYTHAILGQTVVLISKSFGMTILVMLASCLLHLVATSYFLFVELLKDKEQMDVLVVALQLLYCFFHLLRLLLLVEPCHKATFEARKTIVIVCEVLRNCKDSSVQPILIRFWRQLLADRTCQFTACGMCAMNREILTSISGAIATYLVILIQFQKTDG